MRMERDEDLPDFLDRLSHKLTEPAADLKEREVVYMLWHKMPYAVQDEVDVHGRGKVKTVSQLKRLVFEIYNDPLKR